MKMGSNYLAILGVTTVTTVMSCSPAKKEYASFELYPVRTGSLMEMEYTPLATKFYLWSPTAEEVRLMLYDAGEGGHAYETVKMEPTEDGTWTTSVDENLLGKFYAFNVKINDKWQGDTPGINAHAVGVNGKRAAIIDWKTTNPEGWESDRRPSLKSPADIINCFLLNFHVSRLESIDHSITKPVTFQLFFLFITQSIAIKYPFSPCP